MRSSIIFFYAILISQIEFQLFYSLVLFLFSRFDDDDISQSSDEKTQKKPQFEISAMLEPKRWFRNAWIK